MKHEGKTKKYNRESCNFSDKCNLRIMNKDRQQSPTWCEGGHGMTQMRVETHALQSVQCRLQSTESRVKLETSSKASNSKVRRLFCLSMLKFSPWSLLSICLYYDSSYYESSYYDRLTVHTELETGTSRPLKTPKKKCRHWAAGAS